MCTGYDRLHQFNPRATEIGYWTVAGHQGKGLATLVTQMLIITAFEALDSDRITITCNPTNSASQRVIEKCGFRYEGRLRNYYPEPTQEMLQNGYTTERSCFQYALIRKDRPTLLWYASLRDQLTITSSLAS
jgi:RimJ/RimL family protein N-acetyltransferase